MTDPTPDDEAHARCVYAAVRFAEEHDPESPLFARDLRRAAAYIRELEAGRDALKAENERLTRWKAEATEVLAGWERVWDALGRPGPLGASKALSSMVEVNRMREGR